MKNFTSRIILTSKHHLMRNIYVKLLMGLVFVFGVVGVNGQSTVNYTFATNTTGSLVLDMNSNAVDMSTGTTQLVAAGLDATASAATTFPSSMEFWFMGTRFTQFSVNDDGILQLGATAVLANLYTINTGTASLPKFSAFNADLRTGTTTGKIHYRIVGTAPNRCLVVEFKEMQLFYSTAAAGTST